MVCSSSTLRRLACAFLCLGSSLAWSQSQPVFPVLHYDPYAVASPLAMADGDVNGDRIPDTLYVAASSSPGSSTLTSAPHDASGATLSSIAAGTVPCTANSLLLADLNKDNRLDAIVTCTEDKLAVLAGNGDGTFQPATIFTIPKAAKAVAADLNADGYPEIVVATNTGTTDSVFAILLNTSSSGPVSLATPHVYSGADGSGASIPGSAQLFVTDLNNDGKLDIVAGGDPDQISDASAVPFYGNGDGTFHLDLSNHPYLGNDLAFADFDGDGETDSVRIQRNGYPVLTFLTITFGDKSKSSVSQYILPGRVRIQALDINGDGHPDVVFTGGITTVLLNDGTGHPGPAASYATPGAFYIARKGSQGTDLVFSTPRGLYTMHGNAQGQFDGMPAFPTTDQLTAPSQIATGDFNNDGISDVFAADPVFTATRPLVSRGDGSFLMYSTTSTGLKSFPVAGDFNADGLVDRVEINPINILPYGYNNSPQSSLNWYKGAGNGTFDLHGPSTLLGVKGANGAIAGDFDHDGKLDVIVSYFDNSLLPNTAGMVLARGNGDGTFVAPSAPFYTSTSSTQLAPLTSDVDNDGDLDLIWQNTILLNSGAAVFTPVPLSASGTVLAVGDLNGDTIPDLMIGNTLFSGNGDGTFQPSPFATITTPAGATFTSASIGDLDGDGHPDLVLQHMTDMAGFTVAYGDGAGNFTVDPNTYTTGSKTPVSGNLVRLNNQATTHTNRPDYLVASPNGIISLLNQRNPSPGPPLKVATQTVLTSDISNAAPLQPVSLTAKLTGLSPTGTVTFTSSDGTILAKMPAGSVNAFNLQYKFAREGTYTVTASYSGDDVNQPSISAPLPVSVAKASTAISFFIDSGYNFYTGYNSGFDLRVLNTYNPTGIITLSVNGQAVSTAAVAGMPTFRYRFPAAGTYTVTASYPGDAANLPATVTRSVTVVDGPDFTLTASPATATIKAGETATYTLTLTSIRGYSEYVNFTCRPACPDYSLFLGSGATVTATFTIHTSAAGTGGNPAPSITYGPAAAAFLLLGIPGTLKRYRLHWARLGLFSILLAASLFSLAGCSSGSGAGSGSSGGSGQGTPYSFAVSAQGQSSGLEHSVNLSLIVN